MYTLRKSMCSKSIIHDEKPTTSPFLRDGHVANTIVNIHGFMHDTKQRVSALCMAENSEMFCLEWSRCT